MDINTICIAIIITSAAILSLLLLAAHVFYNYIYEHYKARNNYVDFEDALAVLKIIINTELDAYENDIFLSKGSITNSNFDNYYKDITTKIINNVSPILRDSLARYISEDMIYILIARAVKKFLTEKINGTI